MTFGGPLDTPLPAPYVTPQTVSGQAASRAVAALPRAAGHGFVAAMGSPDNPVVGLPTVVDSSPKSEVARSSALQPKGGSFVVIAGQPDASQSVLTGSSELARGRHAHQLHDLALERLAL
jgi:hypothetical protein